MGNDGQVLFGLLVYWNESLHNVELAMLHHQISMNSSLEKFKAFTCRKDVDDLKSVKNAGNGRGKAVTSNIY